MFGVWELSASMCPDTVAMAPGRKRDNADMPNVTIRQKGVLSSVIRDVKN